MSWGIYQDKQLLRRENTIRDALDWTEEVTGHTVHKEKTERGGVYDVVRRDGESMGELRRVDPKGRIAWYPCAAVATFKLSIEDLNMADVIRQRGQAELEYGQKAPVILALHSIGWTERQIAEALVTSRTYVMRVILKPQDFLLGSHA